VAEALAQRLGLGPAFLMAWQIGQWPVIFCFVLLAFELLDHFAPHRPRVKWRAYKKGHAEINAHFERRRNS
jgi:uncharacterized BrkB/YihY/UPF0761 family membrane protein